MGLKLPQPTPATFTTPASAQVYTVRSNQAHENNDLGNRKKGADVELGTGEKLVLRSPNGARWSITVSNAGVVGATAL